eukprot:SAG31_NODE_332_length_17516_cov_3.552840_17_plen_133_part_00
MPTNTARCIVMCLLEARNAVAKVHWSWAALGLELAAAAPGFATPEMGTHSQSCTWHNTLPLNVTTEKSLLMRHNAREGNNTSVFRSDCSLYQCLCAPGRIPTQANVVGWIASTGGARAAALTALYGDRRGIG